jgi:hypothetical protein
MIKRVKKSKRRRVIRKHRRREERVNNKIRRVIKI